LPAYYEQKNINFRTELVEISIAELSIRRSGVYFRGSGLAVDTNAESSVEGLFAAGDCATVSGGIAGAAVLGHIAGEGVVKRIADTPGVLPAVDMTLANDTRAQAEAHRARREGVSWQTFEDETRQTVTDHVGVRRTAKGLQLAIETLRALAKREPLMQAPDLHSLMRVHEAKHVRLNAEIMAAASLARPETRTGSAHWRLDFPKPDEQHWRKFVLVEAGKDGPATRTLSTDRPLADSFTRGAVTT
jgi:succinate dehydrogenase/fumarate reductase flavoprotein subunit